MLLDALAGRLLDANDLRGLLDRSESLASLGLVARVLLASLLS
jgi:hypothetical protein